MTVPAATLLAVLPLPLLAAVPRPLARPVAEGKWVRPAAAEAAEPVWGVRGGIAVGLWPMGGPRGLLRIYAPYLGHPRGRMVNFIAVEPSLGRGRGYSELEWSARDGARGKAMWSGDALDLDPRPRKPWQPARGTVAEADGTETLTVFVFVERFNNGARPIVQIILRADRPHEVTFKLFAAKDSARMRACILSATMGNYARLRRLWLRERVVEAAALWPRPPLDRSGFTPRREWSLDHLLRVGGEVVVAATPNEADPASADYAPSVAHFWRYQGKTATQYWRAPAAAGLVARVNGRTAYWASRAPIPGGIAYENFELDAPFAPGQAFIFGVTPDPPKSLGFPHAAEAGAAESP